jgi:hypothetical protein
MKKSLCCIVLLVFLGGCSKEIGERVQTMKTLHFVDVGEFELASDAQKHEVLSANGLVGFSVRVVLRGEASAFVARWPAFATEGRFKKGDRVHLLCYPGDCSYLIGGFSKTK